MAIIKLKRSSRAFRQNAGPGKTTAAKAKVQRSPTYQDPKEGYAQGTFGKNYKDLNDYERTTLGPYLNPIQGFDQPAPYEPTAGLTGMKAAAAAGAMGTWWNPPAEYGLQLAGSAADLYTAGRYAMDKQWGKAGVDLGQAAIGLIPYAKYVKPKGIDLRKITPDVLYNNKLRAIQKTNDMLTMGEGARTRTGSEMMEQNAGPTGSLVTTVPKDFQFMKAEGNRKYYKRDRAIELARAAMGNKSQGGPEYDDFLNKQLGAGVSPQELVSKGYIHPDRVKDYESAYKPQQDVIYTETPNTTAVQPFKAQAFSGEPIYNNNAISAMVKYPTRNTNAANVQGDKNTGYEDVQMYFTKNKNTSDLDYDRGMYKIPYDQWNKTFGSSRNFNPETLKWVEQFKQASTEQSNATPIKQGGGSVVDYLKATNKPSDYAYREKLAKAIGISNYTGTADQNTKILNYVRKGDLPNGSAKPTATAQPVQSKSSPSPKVQVKTSAPAVKTETSNPFTNWISSIGKSFNKTPIVRGPGEPALESGFIVDKGTNQGYIIKGNKVVEKVPVVTGQNPNMADYTGKSKKWLDTHPKERVTPEGAFLTQWSGLLPGSKHYNLGVFPLNEPIDYPGMPKVKSESAMIHQNYSLDRLPSYTSKNPEARRLSMGCTNLRDEDCLKLQQAMPGKDTVFIINSKTGKGIKDFGYKQSGGAVRPGRKISLKPVAQNGVKKDSNIHGPVGYLNSYYKSSAFQDRLNASNPEPMAGYTGVKYAEKQTAAYTPKFLPGNRWGSFVPPDVKGDVFYDTEQAKNFNFDMNNEVVPHEYSHLTRNLSGADAKAIASKNTNPNAVKLVDEYVNKLGGKYSTGFNSFLKRNNQPDSHDIGPHENYSDLNTLRWMMYERGLYDTRKGKLDLPTLQKALQDPNIGNSYFMKRMLQNFTPEKIVELNNEVAQGKQSTSTNLSQNAGKKRIVLKSKY